MILSRIDRESGFYDFIFLTHEFYWIFKMPTEFYFEIQYFNFDWNITITLPHSHRNTQQWQLKSATYCNSGMLPPNVDHHACADVRFAAAVTRGKVLCWKYRSPRKRNSRPPASVILCWVSWVENVLVMYYASVCLHWKRNQRFTAFLDSKIHIRLAFVTANELGLAFPL